MWRVTASINCIKYYKNESIDWNEAETDSARLISYCNVWSPRISSLGICIPFKSGFSYFSRRFCWMHLKITYNSSCHLSRFDWLETMISKRKASRWRWGCQSQGFEPVLRAFTTSLVRNFTAKFTITLNQGLIRVPCHGRLAKKW